jgi:hypothetical protein
MVKLLSDFDIITNFNKINKKSTGGSKKKSYFDKVESYYQSKKNFTKKLDQDLKYDYKFNTDKEGNHILNIISEDKIVMKLEYDIIGIYNNDIKMWYFGYAVDHSNKLLIKKSKIIKDVMNKISDNLDLIDQKEIEELQFYSDNPAVFTSSDNLSKIVKLMMYLMKSMWFLSVSHSDNYIEFISVRKILME